MHVWGGWVRHARGTAHGEVGPAADGVRACSPPRKPHHGTAISGGISANGQVNRTKPLRFVESVQDLARQGIERLVVCDR